MRKTIFLIALIPICLAFFIAWNVPEKYPVPAAPDVNNITTCALPIPSIPDAPMFNPEQEKLPAVLVRKNFNSLTAAEIASLRAGIAAMKALPVSDKTSWQYQAAIHGTTLAGSQPSWNSCQHRNMFFLSWHRMYLYYFERILRSKSGNPSLTLPYWDYQTGAALPSAYRTPTTGNALFHARNASINAGGSMPPSISTSINTALGHTNFTPFQTSLEGPHGSVHIAIGLDMSDASRAALDPIFWAHHTNIDRLWEAWLRLCGGRANPTTNTTWMNQTYTFFDENGNAVNMTGSQIVATASTLNYRYDFPLINPCLFVFKDWKWLIYRPFRWPDPVIKERVSMLNLERVKQLEEFGKIRDWKFNFKNSETEVSDQIMLELVGGKLEKIPEGVIEVYVNLPKLERPDPKSRSFAGLVDVFALTSKQNQKSESVQIDITQAIANLQLQPADLGKMNLSFVVRGNTVNGKERETNTTIFAESMDVLIRRGMR
jgi:Common central domain of tyrosinase/Polyphenol oxidase middle domain